MIDYVLEYEPVLPVKMGLGKFTKVSTITKVTTFEGSTGEKNRTSTDAELEQNKFTNAMAKLLIKTSKITVLVIFAFFNVLYWGIILSQ